MKDIKPKKLSNKALMDSALNYLKEETKFTFTKIQYGNGYFMFDFGKDTVIWFEVKEIPGFRFALWNAENVNKEGFGPDYKDAELILFTQPLLTIDKFKPSRSAFKVPMFRYMTCDEHDIWTEDWNDCGGVNMMEFIKKHKYRAFHIAQYSDWEPYDYISGLRALYNYIHTHWYYFKENKIETYKRNKATRDIIKRLEQLNNIKAVLSDYGDSWSPRLHLFIHELKGITKDEMSKADEFYNLVEDKYFSEVSFNPIEDGRKMNRIYNDRIKAAEEGEEVLLWKTK